MGLRRGIWVGGAFAAVAAVVAAGPALAGDTEVSCSLQAGTLVVSSSGPDATIARRGEALVVSDFRGDRACEGGEPRVDTVDAIVLSNGGNRWTLDMRGGAFAPGASPEADGSPEIEIEAQFEYGDEVDVLLGRGAQTVRAGRLANGKAGVNLNAESERGSPDADITFRRGDGFFRARVSLSVRAGVGPDRLRGTGGPEFRSPWPHPFLALRGGGGDDRVVGAGSHFNLLTGGSGDDRIRGGRDLDLIAGGAGRDSISGGRGPDLLVVDDGARDDADCGRGRDSFAADPDDRVRRCEEDLGSGPAPSPAPLKFPVVKRKR